MTTGLLKKERDFVVPGEAVVKSMEYLPGKNCFREGEEIKAKKIGIIRIDGRVISVIAFNGVYMPTRGDMIIGEVEDIQGNGWVIGIKSIHSAYLPLSGVQGFIDTTRTDLSSVYAVGDVIYGKIDNVSSDKSSIHIYMKDRMCRKFSGGRIVHMNPAKLPRLIGKKGSMIELIKNKTGCNIVVGQNGLVWIGDENCGTVMEIMKLIEKESHLSGLTNKIENLLGKSAPRSVPNPAPESAAPKKEGDVR